MYYSTKRFGHERGLSACFRQWRAESHCRLLHGYALAVTIVFAARDLDARNWVVDFGSLKTLEQRLKDTFDHKLLVASDDPQKDMLFGLQELGLADIVEVDATGCEAFAKLIFDTTEVWLQDAGYSTKDNPRVRVHSVEVAEHGSNSALYDKAEVRPYMMHSGECALLKCVVSENIPHISV